MNLKTSILLTLFILYNLVGISQKDSIDLNLIQGKWKILNQDSVSFEIKDNKWIGFTYWDGPTVITECPFTTEKNELHIRCCYEEQWYYRIEKVTKESMLIRSFYVINGRRRKTSHKLKLQRIEQQ